MVLEGSARVQALEAEGVASNSVGSSMCMCTSWKSKKQWFRNYHCRNQGGMCYRHNLAGPRDGPRATWAEENHRNGLRISLCANVSRAKMAVYLRIV
jgi:hypothetical protein